jgi:hypothetical protein
MDHKKIRVFYRPLSSDGSDHMDLYDASFYFESEYGGPALLYGRARNGNDVIFRDWLFFEVLDK